VLSDSTGVMVLPPLGPVRIGAIYDSIHPVMGLSGLMEGGYDVECYCGWASKTGGAIKARVAEALTHHSGRPRTAGRVWTTLRLAAGSRPSFARKKTPRALADRLQAARVRVLAPDVGACPVARVAPRGVVRSLLR
jgi:hypothetical protein